MISRIKRFLAQSLNYTLKFSANGNSLKVPVINNVGRANLDVHEEHMRIVLQRLYRPGTLLVDVGTNIGQTLIKYALLAGPDCRYIGFEPNLKAAAYVDEVITRNALSGAVVIPVGLGAAKGITKLLMASAGSTDPAASINPLMRDSSFYAARKIVAVTDGNSALAELGIEDGPIIIKIDVEGGELEVIQGLSHVLADLRPFVVMEILPPANFDDAVNEYRLNRAEELRSLMKSQKFKMFTIGENGEIGMGVPTADYLFVPDERSQDY
jgi:FkbM family methyltransferase